MVKGNDKLTIIGNTDNLKNCQYIYDEVSVANTALAYGPQPNTKNLYLS